MIFASGINIFEINTAAKRAQANGIIDKIVAKIALCGNNSVIAVRQRQKIQSVRIVPILNIYFMAINA